MSDKIKLPNGTEVSAEEFYSWSGRKQSATLRQTPDLVQKRTAKLVELNKDPEWCKARAAKFVLSANDPDRAARRKASLKAAWADPEKRAARLAKLAASNTSEKISKRLRQMLNTPEAKARLSAAQKARRERERQSRKEAQNG